MQAPNGLRKFLAPGQAPPRTPGQVPSRGPLQAQPRIGFKAEEGTSCGRLNEDLAMLKENAGEVISRARNGTVQQQDGQAEDDVGRLQAAIQELNTKSQLSSIHQETEKGKKLLGAT